MRTFIIKGLLGILLVLWLLSLLRSHSLFRDLSYAPVLLSSDGRLLNARVAADGQWRFPPGKDLPDRYVRSLIHYEDRGFYHHLGFSPKALVRAAWQNINAGRVVSGGSTISMQLAKIGLGKGRRNWLRKIEEVWLAVGLEFLYTKPRILKMYASLAPFGSNIVGLEAAMWRYFGKRKEDITWAEAALFTVLPNSPNLILRESAAPLLRQKRDRLLKSLFEAGVLDESEYAMSQLEDLPSGLSKTERMAPHALECLLKANPGEERFNSTLDFDLQKQLAEIARAHHGMLSQKDIRNLAILVVHNPTGEVRAYLGNAPAQSGLVPQGDVDVIQAPRSSGSTLKPFLVASMLDQGLITTRSLVPDIPTLIGGFRPENFTRNYSGLASVKEVIRRSLNVPSVWLLKEYGIPVFYQDLRKLGFSSLFRPWEDYGLSLILGGAEVSAWDLTRAYAGLAYTLDFFQKSHGLYPVLDHYKLSMVKGDSMKSIPGGSNPTVFSAGAIYQMLECMRAQETPGEYRDIAVKTGTSFGFKDAWCVGVTPEYTVAVWVGNASGLSRPGLIGIQTAAPLLYDIFQLLPASREWWCPYDDMTRRPVCTLSGYAPGPDCPVRDTIFSPGPEHNLPVCPYHRSILVSEDHRYRLHKACSLTAVEVPALVLPAVVDHFYKRTDPSYKSLPPMHPSCAPELESQVLPLGFIYPNELAQISAPLDLDGKQNEFLFRAIHQDPGATLYWFLDEDFLGSTMGDHQMQLKPGSGGHTHTIMDPQGVKCSVKIRVL
jgi:penicillin-binding protein 1C